MPDEIRYDAATQTLIVGHGRIQPVNEQVWRYEISGMPVIGKWFSYRRRNPKLHYSATKLDEISADRWTWQTTQDLLALLHVLARVVDLHQAQEQLIDRIVGGVLLTTGELQELHLLPPPDEATKPPAKMMQDTLGI